MTTLTPTELSQERFKLVYDNASLTADLTVVLDAPHRRFAIDSVRYYNATGLAADATNFFNIKVLIAAVIAANWSTETGEEGTIAAATFVTFTNIGGAARTGAAGAVLSVLFDEDGTATLPAGRLVIDGFYY